MNPITGIGLPHQPSPLENADLLEIGLTRAFPCPRSCRTIFQTTFQTGHHAKREDEIDLDKLDRLARELERHSGPLDMSPEDEVSDKLEQYDLEPECRADLIRLWNSWQGNQPPLEARKRELEACLKKWNWGPVRDL
jgi:hypothetical protein